MTDLKTLEKKVNELEKRLKKLEERNDWMDALYKKAKETGSEEVGGALMGKMPHFLACGEYETLPCGENTCVKWTHAADFEKVPQPNHYVQADAVLFASALD